MKTPITSEGLREKFDAGFTSMGMGEKWRPGFEYTPNDIFDFFLADRKALIEYIRCEIEAIDLNTHSDDHIYGGDKMRGKVLELLDSLVEKECCTDCWGWKASESPKEGYCVRKFCKCHKVEKEK